MDYQIDKDTSEKLTNEEINALKALLQNYPVHNHDGRNSLEVASRKVNTAINAQKIILPTDMVCGEDITNGDAVRLGYTYGPSSERSMTYNSTVEYRVSGSLENYYLYQSFQVPTSVKMYGYVACTGIGYGDVIFPVALYSDNNNIPGSVLASGPNINVLVSEGVIPRFYMFSSPYTLQANTKYWIIIGEPQGCRLYASVDTTKPYLNGQACVDYVYSGNHYYSYPDFDFYFAILVEESANKIYKANSISSIYTNNFIGVSNRDSKKGETPEIIVVGIKDDYKNLTAGSKYYLVNYPGGLSTTPGYVSKQVGYAASNNILVVNLM